MIITLLIILILLAALGCRILHTITDNQYESAKLQATIAQTNNQINERLVEILTALDR